MKMKMWLLKCSLLLLCQYQRTAGFQEKGPPVVMDVTTELALCINLHYRFPVSEIGYNPGFWMNASEAGRTEGPLFLGNVRTSGTRLMPSPLLQSQAGFGYAMPNTTLANLFPTLNIQAFNQFRLSHSSYSRPVYDRSVCHPSGAVRGFLGDDRKVVSMLHDRNEPWEVRCLTCRRQALLDGHTHSFHMLPFRDPFAVRDFNRRLTHKPASVTDPAQLRVAALVYLYWAKKLTGKSVNTNPWRMQKRGQATMFAERRRDTFEQSSLKNTGIPALVPDGALLVDPDPGNFSSFYYHWNAMSLVCAEHVDGSLSASDVIVNVDTLVHPEFIERPELKPEMIFLDSFRGYGRTIYDNYDTLEPELEPVGRYRFKDFRPQELAPTDQKRNDSLNLGVSIHWEKWSCCTACCCKTAAECGSEGLIPENCDKVISYRTRRGYCSIYKLDHSRPIAIIKAMPANKRTDSFLRAAIDLDRYLSAEPYLSEGIACFSTLLHATEGWRDIEKLMNEAFDYRKATAAETEKSGTFGPVGMFFDTDDCASYPQKLNCSEWDKCWKNPSLDETEYKPVNTPAPEKPGRTIRPPKRLDDPCANYSSDFEVVFLANKQQRMDLHQGKNYRVVFKESDTVYEWIRWKSGRYFVDEYNGNHSCLEQRLVVAVNEKDLLILNVNKDDTLFPFIAEAMLADGKIGPARKISFFFIPIKSTGDQTNLFLWIGLICGVLVMMLVIVVLLTLLGKHGMQKKKLDLIRMRNEVAVKHTSEQVGDELSGQTPTLTVISSESAVDEQSEEHSSFASTTSPVVSCHEKID